MKALLYLLLRLVVLPVVLVWIWLVWLGDMAREEHLKRKLGPNYEGPAEGWEDLR